MVQVQEVDQVQEVERTDIKAYIAEKASKHVVLHRQAAWNMATSPHAVSPFVGIMMEPTIMIQNGAIRMPRMGVG